MLKSLLNKWLLVDPVALVFQILNNGAIKSQIEEWNRQQLLRGKNSLDIKLSDIGGEYSDYTLSLHPDKQRDRVNLYDTGEFHESITVTVDNSLIFTADPFKEDDKGNVTNLFKEWGEDILGLNEKNIEFLVTRLTNSLIIEILKKVQGN